MKKLVLFQNNLWMLLFFLCVWMSLQEGSSDVGANNCVIIIMGTIWITSFIGIILLLNEEIKEDSVGEKIKYIIKVSAKWNVKCLVIGVVLALMCRILIDLGVLGGIGVIELIWFFLFIFLFMVHLLLLGLSAFLAVLLGVLVTHNKPKKGIYLKIWFVMLVTIICSIRVFTYYHPTFYQYNDRKIIGQEMDKVQEMYGEFDCVERVRAGYAVDGDVIIDFLYGEYLYYWVYFQDGVVTKVELGNRP